MRILSLSCCYEYVIGGRLELNEDCQVVIIKAHHMILLSQAREKVIISLL